MTVWTCTFDYGTYADRQAGLASWADKRRRLLNDLAPGDQLVPYIARIGWVGVWTTTSAARRDPDASAFGEDYPIVAEVTEDLTVPPEQAMRAADLPQPSLLRQDDGSGAPMPYLFQSSGTALPDEVGDELVRLLETWAAAPTERELTSTQTEYRAAERAATPAGIVSIPADETEDTTVPGAGGETRGTTVSDHTRAQQSLLNLGRVLGFTPWVTPDDQSKQVDEDGTSLADLPGVTTDLPGQFNDATNRTIRHIDVMWLQRSRIEAAFEVENSTSIYSGILRMADLLALQPNIDIPLYLVVPEGRLDKALLELQRPVFVTMQRPLPRSCRVLTYGALDELTELANRAGGALRIEVIDQYAVAVDDA
jgi:hypothetical protein